MKKLTIFTGGHPLFAPDDLTHLNESIAETADAFGLLLGNNFYLTNTIIVNDAGFHECAAGCMVYKGELCYFDAQSVANVVGQTVCWVPDITYRALDPISYADGIPKSPHVIKKVKLQMVDLGSPPADYVTYNSFLQKGTAILNTFTAAWTAIGGGGTLKSIPWNTAISPTDAWIRRNVISDALVYSLEYQFRGGLVAQTLTLVVDDATTLFTLPVPMHPTRDLLGCVPLIIKTNEDPADDTHHTAVCKLTTGGDFIVYMPTNAVSGNKVVVYFDGLVLHEHNFII